MKVIALNCINPRLMVEWLRNEIELSNCPLDTIFTLQNRFGEVALINYLWNTFRLKLIFHRKQTIRPGSEKHVTIISEINATTEKNVVGFIFLNCCKINDLRQQKQNFRARNEFLLSNVAKLFTTHQVIIFYDAKQIDYRFKFG